MSKSTAVQLVDPYDHTHPDNKLSVQTQNPLALARRSPIGQIVLAEDSAFMQLATAAGINAPAMALDLASVAARKPEIMRCTPPSIVAFMLDAAKLKLTIGRGIYPVPIPKNKGKVDEELRLEGWVGYMGAKELACRGGIIRDAWATVVFEGDDYEFVNAPVPMVKRHEWGPNKGNMAKAIKVYCTLLYPGHVTRSKEFDREKIESYKKRNKSSGNWDSPWKTAEEEMWQAKAILHTVRDLPHSSPEIGHLRTMLDQQDQEALWQGAPVAQLPAPTATHPDEGPEDMPADEPELTPEQQLRAAHSVFVTFRDGRSRMLSEIRNAQLEKLLTHFREKLDQQPDRDEWVTTASAIAYVLEARKDGRSTEPLAQPEI
jgi:recombinational DNA repair protein RecT